MRCGIPERLLPGPSPSPPAPEGGFAPPPASIISSSSVADVCSMTAPYFLGFGHLFGSQILRNKIIGRAGHAVFVWAAINRRIMAGEIVVRHGSGNRPFERGRAPGIRLRGLAVLDAPEEIEIEE